MDVYGLVLLLLEPRVSMSAEPSELLELLALSMKNCTNPGAQYTPY